MILNKIKDEAETLGEEDLDWIVPELLEHYSSKINYLASATYGQNSNVAKLAFKQLAEDTLYKGMYTYLFTTERWREDRDINSYLSTCLNRLSDKIKADIGCEKKVNVPICPACKFFGQREYLAHEGKLLRCDTCMNEINRLENESNLDKSANDQLTLRRIFVFHTRRGYRCPDCEKFIPESYIKQFGVTCPYNDCFFFGTKDELELMAHPVGLGLNTKLISFNSDSTSLKTNGIFNAISYTINSDEPSAFNKLEITESYLKEHEVLKNVLDAQKNRVERTSTSRLKLLMYEAYQNILEQYPSDMVSYLVHQKHLSSQPIQARIFQEYVRLIENALPFTIMVQGKPKEIYSLLDSDLGIFLGISEYEAVVKSDGIIPNNTTETYTGGRKLKFFGPCFIGMLIDVEDLQTGESYRESVKNYTFSHIKTNIPEGRRVKVTHFRIPSHYEMGGLVYLQRIRRTLVDKIYFILNGKKRIPKGKVEENKESN